MAGDDLISGNDPWSAARRQVYIAVFLLLPGLAAQVTTPPPNPPRVAPHHPTSPRLAAQIFSVFTCRDLTPPGADGAACERYLEADYSVSCCDWGYALFRCFALALLLAVPVGARLRFGLG